MNQSEYKTNSESLADGGKKEKIVEIENSVESDLENGEFSEDEIEEMEQEGNDVIVDGLSRFHQMKESFSLSKEVWKLECEKKLRVLQSNIRGIMDAAEEKIFSLKDSMDKDAFRPQFELRHIRKYSPEERLDRIEKLKAEVKEHIENIASLQSRAIEVVRENPDISKEDLLKTVDGGTNGIKMSSQERSLARKIVNAYCNHHVSLKNKLEKYKSGEELYRALTKSEPEGSFEMIVGPVSVYLKCSSSKDFGVLFSTANLKEGESLSEFMVLHGQYSESTTAGVSFKRTTIGMDGMITAENSPLMDSQEESEEIFVHEEEHAIRNIFDNILVREKEIGTCPDLNKVKVEDRDKVFRSFLRKRRRLVENFARDEFLAYFRIGTSTEKILDKLTNELSYDYLGQYKHIDTPFIKGSFEKAADKKEIIEEVYTNEYGTNLRYAAEAIDALEGAGYSTDDIIAILTYEPLERWKKTATRLTA